MPNQIRVFIFSILAALALLQPVESFAQVKKGEKLFNQGRYAEAVRPLKKDFEGKEQNLSAGILLAKCFYQLNEYQEALDVLSIIGTENLPLADDRRFYADVLIVNDDYSGAYIELIRLLSEDQFDPKTNLWLDKVVDLMAWDSLKTLSSYRLVYGINTEYNEYAPYFTPDDEIWFVTDVTNVQTVFPASYNAQQLHLYYKTTARSGGLDHVNRPTMLIKNRDYFYHDGPMDDWPNQNKYAHTMRDIDAPINGGLIGIYFSDLSGKEEDLIPFKYNETYNTGHPTFSEDGKRMYFASNRPGGFGQMDIWYADWKDGTWTEPRNMGPTVNTPFNEVFPNMHVSRLFFSSDRQDMGYGGLDIYYSSRVHEFKDIYNLRSPINGPYDDFATTFRTANQGFLSSNRPESTGGDDIYAFNFNPTQIDIVKPRLRIIDPDILADTEVYIYDMDRNLVATTKLEADGAIPIDSLKSDEVYTVAIGGEGVTDKAKLILYDKHGELVEGFIQNPEDEFQFEITPDYNKTLKKKNIDDSLLEFEIAGKIIADEGTNIAGVPISLKSSDGVVVATVKTSEEGSFAIPGAKLGEEYSIETDGLDDYHEIDIYGKSGAITQSLTPMGNNQFAYTRAAPSALWMLSQDVTVDNVFGVILNNEPVEGESVVLFDEDDAELARPNVDEDGFLTMGSLMAGKAYRLNMPERELNRDHRLVILDGNGDTSQTVRPFDANNYFFEYLLYSDYGAVDEASEIAQTDSWMPTVEENEIYKMKIDDFKTEEPTAFLLKMEGKDVADTIYVSPNGVVVLRDFETNVNYHLQPVDSNLIMESKQVHVYNSDNKEVFNGMTTKSGEIDFMILPVLNFRIDGQDVADDGVLNMGFSGKVYGKRDSLAKMTVMNSKRVKLAESFVGSDGSFAFKNLKSDGQYIVELENSLAETFLEVFVEANQDSLKVSRQSDSLFYVNFAGEALTLIDNNKEEVVVKAGTKIELDNIYYDFNSYTPKSSSRPSMDRLLAVMENNPSLKIEIHSHTDSRGPANYNILLSQKRAGGVVDYLISKGIDKSRITPVGMGETQLTNRCSDGVRCSNPEHAKNRRTELVIISND